jgi:hypothetical protein
MLIIEQFNFKKEIENIYMIFTIYRGIGNAWDTNGWSGCKTKLRVKEEQGK